MAHYVDDILLQLILQFSEGGVEFNLLPLVIYVRYCLQSRLQIRLLNKNQANYIKLYHIL